MADQSIQYRHYQDGAVYTIIGRAKLKDFALPGEMVIYQDETGQHWIRPAADFFGALVINSDGDAVRRFAPVNGADE